MNEKSSRSHSVFLLNLFQHNKEDDSKISSTLVLVDLAGSEKVGKTGATGLTLKQAQYTNKSLTTLGMVIKSLTDGSKHVPYRDSKLTRLLTDSLGGNSKTCLIVNCSPSFYNIEETISTLRFGTRVKTIKNKPIKNVEISVLEYKRMLAEAYDKINVLEKKVNLLSPRNNSNIFLSSQDDEIIKNFEEEIDNKNKEILILKNDFDEEKKYLLNKIDVLEESLIEKESELDFMKTEYETIIDEPSGILTKDSVYNKQNLEVLLEEKQKIINILEKSLKRFEETLNYQKNDYENIIEMLKCHNDELRYMLYRPIHKNNNTKNIIIPIKKKNAKVLRK